MVRIWRYALTGLAALTVAATAHPAAAATPPPVRVVAVAEVTSQDVAPQPGSEPDTVVEPDVAVSPTNSQVAVAVSHDGRYPDGGAVGISYAWTADGGTSWHHRPLPGITSSTGGPKLWARASDPVVAFGPDGDVYVSTLLIALDCPSAVAVSRSTDGGRTFGRPVLAHKSTDCAVSDDKNTITVDTGAHSPHLGRIYQFWTPFLTDEFGNSDGSPQALVYSDDHGRTWSGLVAVTAPHANAQNSTPMVQPDGTVVDAFLDYGSAAQEDEDTAFRGHDADAASRARTGSANDPLIRTVLSTDGGRTFRAAGTVPAHLGGPNGIRCCLNSATVDTATGRLYVAWNAKDPTKVELSSSADGRHWGTPQTVDRPSSAYYGVNVDVSAYDHTVAVSYGLTNANTARGRFVYQQIVVSRDDGRHFGPPVGVGPRSDLKYAAFAGGLFPGDYIGTSIAHDGRLLAVWCVSSTPPDPSARYHQVVYGAVLAT